MEGFLVMMKKGSADKGKSSPMNTAVGSGSKPSGGKINIKTSAPMDPRTLGGRAPKGWLK